MASSHAKESEGAVGILVVADRARWASKRNVADLFRKALQEKGVTLSSIIRDYWQLSRGDGRLTIFDYFRYRLYLPGIPQAEKRAFLSDTVHWPICERCSSVYWRAATEDKWLSYLILQQAGIAAPDLQAVYDSSLRSYGTSPTIRGAEELKSFLQDRAKYPIFVKPNGQLASFGAFVIQEFDGSRSLLHDGSARTPDEILTRILGDNAYLFQRKLLNHPDLAELSAHLATLRLINFVRASDVYTPFAVLKIPAGANVADNFWRAGNMLAEVNIESGAIGRVVRGHGPDTEVVDTWRGLKLPMWEDALDLNRQVARIFAPVAFNSLDIGLTADGPVVVEVNSGSSFDLAQMATGRGILLPEVRDFFASHGWPPKRRWRK